MDNITNQTADYYNAKEKPFHIMENHGDETMCFTESLNPENVKDHIAVQFRSTDPSIVFIFDVEKDRLLIDTEKEDPFAVFLYDDEVISVTSFEMLEDGKSYIHDRVMTGKQIHDIIETARIQKEVRRGLSYINPAHSNFISRTIVQFTPRTEHRVRSTGIDR